jgi:hypothetical protein
MVPLPVRIYKHWIGFVAITLVGSLVIGLLWAGLSSLLFIPGVNRVVIFTVAAVAITFVLLATAIQLYVYSLSYIELNPQGVVIKNWVTLFVDTDESFEWVKLSRATSKQGGIFGQVLNFGTIGIETNGGSVQAVITLIPRPIYWQDQIQKYADLETPEPVIPVTK